MLKKTRKGLALTLAIAMTLVSTVGCQPKTEQTSATASIAPASTESAAEAVGPEDDFYEYVNKEWLDKTELTASQSSYGISEELQDQADKDLRALFDQGIAEGKDKGTDNNAKMFSMYKMALDFEARDAAGIQPIQGEIDKIKQITSLQGVTDMGIEDDNFPFANYGTGPSLTDSNKNILTFQPPELSLGDKNNYNGESESSKSDLALLEEYYIELLVLAGETPEQAATIAKQCIAFETKIANNKLTTEEAADFEEHYVTMPYDEFNALTQNIDFTQLLNVYYPEIPNEIVVTDVDYFKNFDQIFKEENIEEIKSYLYVQTLQTNVSVLTTDFLEAFLKYDAKKSGTTEIEPLDEVVFSIFISGDFSKEASDLYGRSKLSPDAKQKVTDMTYAMIETYEKNIQELEWMSAPTKAAAIEKLDTMNLKIGYPETFESYIDDFEMTPPGEPTAYYENCDKLKELATKEGVASLYEPVDKAGDWETSFTVNAFYSPLNNEIAFPVAILQAPFYDPSQSVSENFGGIGSVIGHELTHAFDDTGAKFDENGNMVDWWTPEDYAEFERLSQDVIDMYGKEIVDGTPVNGTLTLGENIADLGGVNCALETAQQSPDFNAEEFFEFYAKSWCSEATPEYTQMLLESDEHAPDKIRVNTTLSNVPLFLETYDIKEGDPMYLSPEEMVKVW